MRRRGGLRGRFRGAGHHRGDLRHVCHWSVLFHFRFAVFAIDTSQLFEIEFISIYFISFFSFSLFQFISSNFYYLVFLLFHSIFKINLFYF